MKGDETMMAEMMSGSCAFWTGLVLGTCWAALLWLNLPGQTPHLPRLSRRTGLVALGLSGGLAWLLWAQVFGPVSAFFCLGGWGMIFLCLAPILWACLKTGHSPKTRHSPAS